MRLSRLRSAGLLRFAGTAAVLPGLLPAVPRTAIADERPAPAPGLLVNGSFEDAGPGGPAGWELSEGARDGDTEQKSEVASDREFVRDGKASLRLSGGAGTTSWQLVRQRAAVAAGQRVTLRFSARSVNVRKELRQYANANALLEFVDEKGERIELAWSPQFSGTRDWKEMTLTAFAPARTAAVWAGFFLSQSGTMWVDGARLVAAPADAASPEGRAAAFDAVEAHLRATYPFFGLGKKPEADAWTAKARERCLAAADETGFVQALRASLGTLDDLHVWMRHGTATVGTAGASMIRPNVQPDARNALLTAPVADAAPFVAGRVGEGDAAVGYVEIPSWRLDEAAVARLEKILDGFTDCRGLILDVRANAGGDEAIAQRIASRFAKEDVVYARSRVRDPWGPPGSLTPPADRILAARRGTAADLRPVAVLQGPWCMSSCEGFLLMARALPTVTTVGGRSRGASANPRPITVLPNLQLFSSTWRTYLPGGGDGDGADTIEGRGIDPEAEVKWVVGATDPVLVKALELVRR